MRQFRLETSANEIHKFLGKIRGWRTSEPELTVLVGTAATLER
jgi:hypothetical protein